MDEAKETVKHISGLVMNTTEAVSSTSDNQEQITITHIFVVMVVIAFALFVIVIVLLVQYILKGKRDRNTEKQAPVVRYTNTASGDSAENIAFIMPHYSVPEAVLDVTHHPEGIESGRVDNLVFGLPQQLNRHHRMSGNLHPKGNMPEQETVMSLLAQCQSKYTLKDKRFVCVFIVER